MSDSVRPHRRQPTRLPCPWDFPGKNAGVGCHFLLQCMKMKSEREVAQSCPTLCDPMDCSLPGSSVHGIFFFFLPHPTPCPWDFPGKSTGVGCHCLLRITQQLRINIPLSKFAQMSTSNEAYTNYSLSMATHIPSAFTMPLILCFSHSIYHLLTHYVTYYLLYLLFIVYFLY